MSLINWDALSFFLLCFLIFDFSEILEIFWRTESFILTSRVLATPEIIFPSVFVLFSMQLLHLLCLPVLEWRENSIFFNFIRIPDPDSGIKYLIISWLYTVPECFSLKILFSNSFSLFLVKIYQFYLNGDFKITGFNFFLIDFFTFLAKFFENWNVL